MIGQMSERLPTGGKNMMNIIKYHSHKLLRGVLAAGCLFAGSILPASAADNVAGNSLQSVDFAELPGNKAQITLTLSKPAPAPLSFTIDNPARIALDFADTSNNLDKRSQNIGIGMAESITAVEAQGRTRVVVNLVDMVPYEAHADGKKVILLVQNAGGEQSEAAAMAARATGGGDDTITNIDFRRGADGQGRVIVDLSDPSIPVDMQQQGGKVIVDFYRAQLPEELERRLDVLDFATPVKTIDTYTRGNNVHMVITPMGDYDYLAYQSNNQFTIEVKALTKEEVEASKKDEFGYSGERLSLNFQATDDVLLYGVYARGYKPGRFSFNVSGGRCEACKGDGTIKIEMHFLPDVYVTCETCKGHRYNRETLEIHFKGKSIADVLEMTCEDAQEFFKAVPAIREKMDALCQVGLGYIKVGQQATTLSGGEAQRVKLSKELAKRSTGRTLYILDEPTTGLHFHDVAKLLEVLHQLVEARREARAVLRAHGRRTARRHATFAQVGLEVLYYGVAIADGRDIGVELHRFEVEIHDLVGDQTDRHPFEIDVNHLIVALIFRVQDFA